MPQMTHSKPIKSSSLLTQDWLVGLQQYRDATAMFPHSEAPVVKQSGEPDLPSYDKRTKRCPHKNTEVNILRSIHVSHR